MLYIIYWQILIVNPYVIYYGYAEGHIEFINFTVCIYQLCNLLKKGICTVVSLCVGNMYIHS